MVKPDAMDRCLTQEIEKRIRRRDLRIVRRVVVAVDRALILRLWPGIFRQSTLERSFGYLAKFPLPVWLVEGNDAVKALLDIKKEMRDEYCGPEDKLHTLFHCPDTNDDFLRECPIFFPTHSTTKLS